ncbi:MAG: Na+/H+ antiporter NhaA [Alphaproteobacteria bacterium CG_4_9_14_3_um_filter_47_13]|nr:MAG: Na+/H+ antiporter NhaA [Alphaproteobacteria bacterium CG_4_9_14_3_um_filter_47_13]
MIDLHKKCKQFGRRLIKAEKRVVHDVEGAVVAAERKILQLTKDFLHLEASGGILLMVAATAALLIANSPFYSFYHYLLEGMDFRIGFSDYNMGFDAELKKSILHWINDGLMVIFFFLVGLEIKREFLAGELSSRERAFLPALAAVGGMIMPALYFWGFNNEIPENLAGWAIPAATDIAFALGILSLLGNRIPPSIKVLLMAIAVLDDIGAVLIIAIFYTNQILPVPLYIAGGSIAVLFLLNRSNVVAKTPYVLVSIILWMAVVESGIHATLAGVVAALFIPMHDKNNVAHSPLKNMENYLHPWVAFCVLPLFAFANAGVSFSGLTMEDLLNPVSVGIAAGLVAGKQIGIFAMLWIAIKTGLSPKPKNATWLQLYAVSVLCGIGFTMSLFIGTLAYASLDMQVSVRVGVLAGSLLSAIGGYLLLLYSTNGKVFPSSQKIREKTP